MGWMGLDENSLCLWPSILSHQRQPPASRAPGPDQALKMHTFTARGCAGSAMPRSGRYETVKAAKVRRW
jgi:hypothetical protein